MTLTTSSFLMAHLRRNLSVSLALCSQPQVSDFCGTDSRPTLLSYPPSEPSPPSRSATRPSVSQLPSARLRPIHPSSRLQPQLPSSTSSTAVHGPTSDAQQPATRPIQPAARRSSQSASSTQLLPEQQRPTRTSTAVPSVQPEPVPPRVPTSTPDSTGPTLERSAPDVPRSPARPSERTSPTRLATSQPESQRSPCPSRIRIDLVRTYPSCGPSQSSVHLCRSSTARFPQGVSRVRPDVSQAESQARSCRATQGRYRRCAWLVVCTYGGDAGGA